MKYVKFTAVLPEVSGVMDYDDEEFESARDSGELSYHGLDFLQAEPELTWVLVDGPED